MRRTVLLAVVLALPPSIGCGARTDLWIDDPPPDAAEDDGSPDEARGREDGGDDGLADDRGDDDDAADDAPAGDGGPVDRTIAVAAGRDDALQDPGGRMLPDYSWISLYSPEHRGGLRFILDDVPAHATLLEAVLEVYIDSAEEGDPVDTLYRQVGRDPEPFTTDRNDLGARPLSGEAVTWYADDLPAGWAAGPSVVPLLQPLLDAPDYVAGDAFVVIFVPGPEAGGGRAFEFRQFDHPGAFAPRLRLRYLPP